MRLKIIIFLIHNIIYIINNNLKRNLKLLNIILQVRLISKYQILNHLNKIKIIKQLHKIIKNLYLVAFKINKKLLLINFNNL